MKLLLDIGNTRIKWGLASADQVESAASAPHGADVVAELVAALPAGISEAWAVNVAGPTVEAELTAALRARFGVELQLFRSAQSCRELTNGYEAFEQLGADRWAAIAGAWFRYRERVCVVDAGTAVTIDTVEANGKHRGGIILPGIRLMAATLNRETSDIEGFAQRGTGAALAADDWYGKDTLSAVQRGAHFALRAAITQAATPAAGELMPRLIMTGGDAEVLLPNDIDCEHRPQLVLEGVLVLSGVADA